MDKHAARKVLSAAGIAVPATLAVSLERWEADREEILGRIESEIGFPCVVKPSREGCSTAIRKIHGRQGLPEALEGAFQWDALALVEEFLTGMEVTCGVLGNENPEALVPSETIPTQDILSLEDKFLYGQGENKTPARLPREMLEKIRETAVRAYRALGLRAYARIDLFVRRDGEVAVLEPNTLPGMTPSTVLIHQAAAAGMTQGGLVDRVIMHSLDAHKRKKGPL
jgi:D-alanine-D-alanine ligase